MVSPFFSERTDFLLKGPGVAGLLVELPIGLGDGGRPHEAGDIEVLHRLVALSFPYSIAYPGSVHARVDYEMCDVDILRPEFARGALRNCAQAEFRGGECRVSDPAAQAGGRACEENCSAPARDHQASRLTPRDEAGVAGHLPDLAEHAVGRLEQREVDVGADVENANLERRMLVGVLQKSGKVIFLARVERAREDSAAACLDVGDQRRELVALPASREYGEALSCEFFCDRAADVIAGSDHRRRGISVFQRTVLPASNGGRPLGPCYAGSLAWRYSLISNQKALRR